MSEPNTPNEVKNPPPAPPSLSPEQIDAIKTSAARCWDYGQVKTTDRARFINFCVEEAQRHHREISQ